MKTRIMFLVLLPLLFISCSFNGVRGNGESISELREVHNFNRFDVSGNFDVNIKVGENERVEIFAESNLMKFIKTRVKKNTLYLSTRKNLRPTEDLMVLISVPKLYAIDCSGINDIVAENIDSEKFDIDLSGAGSINISGKTGLLRIDVSGAADLMAKELITEDIRIDVSGAANAEIFASNSCKAEVSGAGFIELYGDATDVNMDISGAGSLERR